MLRVAPECWQSWPLLSPLGGQPQHWQNGCAMPLGPKPSPRLGVQAYIPRDLVPKPSRLETPELHPRTPLPQSRKHYCLELQKTPQMGRNLHTLLRPPPPSAPKGTTNMKPHSQPETLPQLYLRKSPISWGPQGSRVGPVQVPGWS